MNKDTVAGAIQETGGNARKNIGHFFGDTEAEALGAKDELEGKIRKEQGELKDALSGN